MHQLCSVHARCMPTCAACDVLAPTARRVAHFLQASSGAGILSRRMTAWRWPRAGYHTEQQAFILCSGAAAQAGCVCSKVEARDQSRPTSAPTCSRCAWHAWHCTHPLFYRAVLLVEVVASTYVCTAAGAPIPYCPTVVLSNSGRSVSMITWFCKASGCLSRSFSSCMSLSCVLHVALHTATQHSRGKGLATACGSWLGCWPDWMAPGHYIVCLHVTPST